MAISRADVTRRYVSSRCAFYEDCYMQRAMYAYHSGAPHRSPSVQLRQASVAGQLPLLAYLVVSFVRVSRSHNFTASLPNCLLPATDQGRPQLGRCSSRVSTCAEGSKE